MDNPETLETLGTHKSQDDDKQTKQNLKKPQVITYLY